LVFWFCLVAAPVNLWLFPGIYCSARWLLADFLFSLLAQQVAASKTISDL